MKKNKTKASKKYHNRKQPSQSLAATQQGHKNAYRSSDDNRFDDTLVLHSSRGYRVPKPRTCGKFREIAYLLDYTRSRAKRTST